MKTILKKTIWVFLIVGTPGLKLSAGETVAESFGIQPPEIAAWTAPDRELAREKAERLRNNVLAALAAGEKNIVIPKDNYLFDQPLSFRNLDGVYVQGSGATLWTEKDGRLEFSNCVNCVAEDLIVDRLQYPFIQGVVSEIVPGGSANGGDRIVLDLEPGSMPAENKGRIGRTLCRSARTGRYYYRPKGYAVDRKAEKKPGQWVWFTRPSMVDPQAPKMEIGDRVSLHTAVPGFSGLHVFNCGAMRFQDISVYTAPGFQVFERGVRSPGGNTYTRLKIIPRPGSSRLSTSTMDGFHSYNQKVGPTLIDCEIAGTYDDGMNIHGFMNVILQKISNTEFLLCSQFGRDYEVGTELSFYKKPTLKPIIQADVTAFEKVSFETGDPQMESATAYYKTHYGLKLRRSGPTMEFYRVTVDRPVDADAFDMAVSSDYCGRSAHLKNLYIHDGCNRGVIIKARNALVENCRFDSVFFGGLYVAGELGPLEGNYADHVTIRNNQFDTCGYYSLRTPNEIYSSVSPVTVLASVAPKHEMAFLHIVPERLFSDLTVTGNTIRNSPGIAMFIANVKGGMISDNHIINPLQETWLYPQINLSLGNRLERTYAPALTDAELAAAARPLYGIYVVGSEDVVLSGNTVVGLPVDAEGSIGIGPWTQNISIREQ